MPIMKKLSLLILFAVLFSNCKPDKKEENTISLKDTTIKEVPFVLNVEKIDSTQFPPSIKYEGFVKNAFRWKDKLGDNLVILTETGISFNDKFKHELDGRDAELFAYHFIVSENEVKQTWKVYDFISDCPVDIAASFIKNAFEVTDLDKNGIAETWLIYETACHGDVSPSNMKIIMYENNKKYAMRGETKIQVVLSENGKKQFLGGEYKLDENFKKGPKVFKEFAQKLWNDNTIEN